MNVEDLIRYHNESENLDFKLEEYKGSNKAELIKDVLAFANAEITGDRYIIFGIKKAGEAIKVNAINEPFDSASIQQYVHANISPELHISYEPYTYEAQQLVVLTIREPTDQPYAAVKDLQVNQTTVVRKNEMLIRKGSYRMLISRADLDRIYGQKFRPATLDGQVEVTFTDGTRRLEIPSVRHIELPSLRNKREIEEQIRWKEELIGTDPKTYSQRFGNHRGLQNSYAEMDLPALRSRLETVEMNYQDEDKHYLQETRAYLLNLCIVNNGEQHLEQTMVQLIVPELSGFVIASRIALNTYQQSVATGINYQAGYPRVVKENTRTIITSEPGEVRHQFPVNVYQQPLRLIAPESLTGQSLELAVTIHGRNLRAPQTQVLELLFK